MRDYKKGVSTIEKIQLPNCVAEMITPKELTSDVVVLYIHGGGYCVGDIEYARGFATTLAVALKCKTMSVAYRLAPDNKYPAALLDVLDAYNYLVSQGIDTDKIVLVGESAGAGLCYALALKLKLEKYRLPLCIVAISPWVDLTLKHKSYVKNKKSDPSLTYEKLAKYASMYTDDVKDKFVSPGLTSRYKGMPDTYIVVSGNEILLDDALLIHKRYVDAGSNSTIVITPNMWHAYVVNDVPESRRDLNDIENFIKECIIGKEKTKMAETR
jgi:acetyl esterase/lipase